MSTLGMDRVFFYIDFYMRPRHEIANAGKSSGQWEGESWDGSAGKAGGRCEEAGERQSALFCALHTPLCSQSKGQSNESVHKRKRREALEGRRRKGTDAERDQSVKQRLSNIGQKERRGGREHQARERQQRYSWRQGRVKILNRWASNYLTVSNVQLNSSTPNDTVQPPLNPS